MDKLKKHGSETNLKFSPTIPKIQKNENHIKIQVFTGPWCCFAVGLKLLVPLSHSLARQSRCRTAEMGICLVHYLAMSDFELLPQQQHKHSNTSTSISTYKPTAVASKPCGSAKPAKDGLGPSGWPKSR